MSRSRVLISPTTTATEFSETDFCEVDFVSDVADVGLAAAGQHRIERAMRSMPVLARVRERFESQRPLAGLRVGACLPVTAETAVLMHVLRAAGASVALASSNPLSTQDDVAAALSAEGMSVWARRGADRATYYSAVRSVLDTRPGLLLDDGCDLVGTLHEERRELLAEVIGACEQTTTGVLRLRQMASNSELFLPVLAVDSTPTKRVVDNRWGTGQSTVDGLVRATGVLLAGRTAVVAGFGDCGRGVAARLRGLGAQVVVTEIDATAALDAALDGYRVMTMLDASAIADIVVTATGNRDVVSRSDLQALRDGAILANAGHFDIEIDVLALRDLAVHRHAGVRPGVDEYVMADGRRLLLVAEGRVVGLAAAEGHPPQVMDVAFALQALAAVWLLGAAAALGPGVHAVPHDIDREVAQLALAGLGVRIDALTAAQERYSHSWRTGT